MHYNDMAQGRQRMQQDTCHITHARTHTEHSMDRERTQEQKKASGMHTCTCNNLKRHIQAPVSNPANKSFIFIAHTASARVPRRKRWREKCRYQGQSRTVTALIHLHLHRTTQPHQQNTKQSQEKQPPHPARHHSCSTPPSTHVCYHTACKRQSTSTPSKRKTYIPTHMKNISPSQHRIPWQKERQPAGNAPNNSPTK
jgi:hypothetical protein